MSCFFLAAVGTDLWTGSSSLSAQASRPGRGPPASANRSLPSCARPNGPSTPPAGPLGTTSMELSPRRPLPSVRQIRGGAIHSVQALTVLCTRDAPIVKFWAESKKMAIISSLLSQRHTQKQCLHRIGKHKLGFSFNAWLEITKTWDTDIGCQLPRQISSIWTVYLCIATLRYVEEFQRYTRWLGCLWGTQCWSLLLHVIGTIRMA